VRGPVGAKINLPNQNTMESYFYAFDGWNENTGGTGTNYAAGQSYTLPATDTALYARWKQKKNVTVTFDANGGTGAANPPTRSGPVGTTFAVAGRGTLEKEGYTFGGWNARPDGMGMNRVPGSYGWPFPEEDVTLYAKWDTIPPSFELPYQTNLSFGNVAIGQTETRSFGIRNLTNGALALEIAYPDGYNGPATVTVSANDTKNIAVTFEPTATGTNNGTVIFTVLAATGESTGAIAVNGKGTPALPAYNPDVKEIGSVYETKLTVKTSVIKTITVKLSDGDKRKVHYRAPVTRKFSITAMFEGTSTADYATKGHAYFWQPYDPIRSISFGGERMASSGRTAEGELSPIEAKGRQIPEAFEYCNGSLHDSEYPRLHFRGLALLDPSKGRHLGGSGVVWGENFHPRAAYEVYDNYGNYEVKYFDQGLKNAQSIWDTDTPELEPHLATIAGVYYPQACIGHWTDGEEKQQWRQPAHFHGTYQTRWNKKLSETK